MQNEQAMAWQVKRCQQSTIDVLARSTTFDSVRVRRHRCTFTNSSRPKPRDVYFICRSFTKTPSVVGIVSCGGSRSAKTLLGRSNMSFMERVARARAELDERGIDPWKRILERHLPASVQTISSAAILDLLDVPPTTGNARRLAKTMRSLGFIPLKSRRLMPGGFRDTTIRGWARPIRESNQ
jgi:hypothetical protein